MEVRSVPIWYNLSTMNDRVFLVHRWDGSPEADWYPWLKGQLEAQGIEVHVLVMPNPEEPRIETWIPTLASAVGIPDARTFFVGHSIGCQTIIRYLQTLPAGSEIGGAVFVAGWYDVRNLETEEEKRIVGPWVNEPRDDAKIKLLLNGKSVALFSDNDPFIDPVNADHWKNRVGARVQMVSGMGHFTSDDGVTELPAALEALKEKARLSS